MLELRSHEPGSAVVLVRSLMTNLFPPDRPSKLRTLATLSLARHLQIHSLFVQRAEIGTGLLVGSLDGVLTGLQADLLLHAFVLQDQPPLQHMNELVTWLVREFTRRCNLTPHRHAID